MAVQTITNPKEQTVNVVVAPGQTIAFDFALDTANFERSGNDLTISLEDGGQIVLGDFFIASDVSSLPPLQLADGTQVNSGDFLSAFDVDVTPAAGEIPTSGLNAYSDGAGDLVDGLNLSDSLDTFYWNAATARTEEFEGNAITLGGAPIPTPQSGPDYNARVVLYEPNPANAQALGTPLNFNVRIPGPLTIVDQGGNYVDFSSMTNLGGDVWSFELSAAGLQALIDSAAGKEYDYITIRDINGVEYKIQIVLNKNGSFDSAYEDSLNAPDADFKGEWHTQNEPTYGIDSSSSNRVTPGDEYWLQGMTADNAKDNTVITNAGADSVHMTNGMLSSFGGTNTINTGKDAGDSIDIGSNVVAAYLGQNNLTSGTIEVSATTPEGVIIAKGGENNLNASGNINLNMAAEAGKSGVGVDAKFQGVGGKNIIHSDSGTVDIKVSTNGGSYTTGVQAGKASSNTVDGRVVDIDVKAQNGGAAPVDGVKSHLGGENTISATDSASIKVESNSASKATGLLADKDGANLVEVSGGNLDVEVSTVTGVSTGMQAGGGNASSSNYDARNELNASGNVNITLKGGTVQGMHAQNTIADGNHGNFINAGGDVTIDASDANAMMAYGMQALDSGHNEINAITGKALIEAHGKYGASGMNAGDQNLSGGTASNVISAKDAELDISSDDIAASYGMSANAGGSNVIDASNSVKVKVESTDMEAYGLWTGDANAENSISINGTSGSGVSIDVKGKNTSSANESVAGLFAESGKNTVHAESGNITLTVDATAGRADGMHAGGSFAGTPEYQAKNVLKAADGNIELNITGKNVYGMSAQHTKADGNHGNFIDASGNVTINAGDAASLNSYGMMAADDAYNSIKSGGEVNINVDAQFGSIGMLAHEPNGGDPGKFAMNIIKADTVSINANSAHGDAYAMWAKNSASNEIHGVTVTLTATAIDAGSTGFAMYAEDHGINLVQLEAGGSVTINGEVYADTDGQNILSGTNADEVFTLHGKVGVNALVINGNGGDDKLVLQANDWAEFQEYYKDWLDDVAGTLDVKGIEVSLGNGNVNQTDVMDYLNGLFGSNPDIVVNWSDNGIYDALGTEIGHISGGLGQDTLNISQLGDSDLSDIAVDFSGFEHIDLSGHGANELTIDALLDGLVIDGKIEGSPYEGGTALRITGDVGTDTVAIEPSSNWSHDGSTTYTDAGGLVYDVYTNSIDSTQYLLIQQGLV